MCGIAGIVGSAVNGSASRREALDLALDRLRHRGPDDRGSGRFGPVDLGMTRLAIIDLEGGRQPATSSRGHGLVMNGEIYNYVELRAELGEEHFVSQSDTEVLLRAWERWGARCLDRLVGMFAFALFDPASGELVLGRDRLGQKPLYFFESTSSTLLFASELKALVAMADALGHSLSLSDQAVYDYLSLGVVPQPYTVYRDVYAVPPASTLTYRPECGLKIRPYWALRPEPKLGITYGEAQQRVRALMSDAVQLRLRADVPVGVFLSGGLDSTVVAYEASRVSNHGLRTFTVSVGDPTRDESAVAARTARMLRTEHRELRLDVVPRDELERLVDHYDQPYADSSAIPSLAIARLAREHTKVVLNGDGGDEIFAGYRRYLAATWAGWVPPPLGRQLAPLAAHLASHQPRRSLPGFAARFVRGIAADPADRYLLWLCDVLGESDKRDAWQKAAQRPTEAWVGEQLPLAGDPLDRQLLADIRINLLSDLLVKMDIATMAASLEARSPFLDHRLAEFAFRLPARYRVRGGKLKAVLRDAYRGLIPDEVIDGKKRGFEVPLERWLSDDLRPLVFDLIGAPNAKVKAFLEGRFVDDILERRTMKDRNWPHIVYSLLVLELWLRRKSPTPLPARP